MSRYGSVSSQDICARLKALEDENAALRRQRNELNLQLLEQGGHQSTSGGAESSLPTQESEASLAASRSRELESERLNLELSTRNKRLMQELEAQTKTVSELRQRLTAQQDELTATRRSHEKDRSELELLRAELSKASKNMDAAVRIVMTLLTVGSLLTSTWQVEAHNMEQQQVIGDLK